MALARESGSALSLPKNRLFNLPNALFIIFCIVLSAPVLLIFVSWFWLSDGGLAYFYQQGLLKTYTVNSVLIALGTGVMTLLIGTLTAFCVTCTNMPFRKIIRWVLLLPFAVPGYVAAIVYADMFDSAGTVQVTLREWTGLAFGEYWFPSIRSLEGAVFILSITLYPYIYLLASTAFATQPRHMLETGKLLGLRSHAIFFRLMVPMARPMLAVGVALVMMEALADFGVVSLFGVPTYTTGIYRSWQGLYDPIAAAQMASLLLACVLIALWLERRSRQEARYANPNAVNAPPLVFELSMRGKYLSLIACSIPVLFGFLLPMLTLLHWTVYDWSRLLDGYTLHALLNSLTLGILTAVVATVLGLVLVMRLRFDSSRVASWFARLATSGYAMPGSVVAVGILLLLIIIQNQVLKGEILLTGTIAAMVWACSFRFLTISFNTTESGLARVTPLMDDAAKTLGLSHAAIVRHIHMPLIHRSMLAGFLLVFVDTVKELPATILLRPFNFDTLAIRTYELAGDELLQRAGPSALMLVLISLLPIFVLAQRFSKSTHKEA